MTEEESNENIPWYLTKLGTWAIVGMIILGSLIPFGYLAYLSVDPSVPDLSNYYALTVEIVFGIIVAIIVYRTSKISEIKNNKVLEKIQTRVSDITPVITEQDENRKFRLKLHGPKILDQLKQIKRSFEDLKTLYLHENMGGIISDILPSPEDLEKQKSGFCTFIHPKYGLSITLVTPIEEEKIIEMIEPIKNDLDSFFLQSVSNSAYFASVIAISLISRQIIKVGISSTNSVPALDIFLKNQNDLIHRFEDMIK